MASHGMSVVELRRGAKRGLVERQTPVARPPLNRACTSSSRLPARRPRRRRRPAPDLRGRRPDARCKGTLQQLRRRADPVGHGALGRGELQPATSTPPRRRPRSRGYAASYARYGVNGVSEPRLGRGGPAVRPRPQEPHEPFRLRLDRRGRPVRPGLDAAQAHDARPVQARGRQRHDRRQRQGRGLHGRRRAVRLHLQVRLRRDLRPRPAPGGRGAATCAC